MKPPSLPMMIFILSDWENRELACDIAKELEAFDKTLVSWDFEEPAHNALAELVDVDFGTDLGDPRLHPHGDSLKSITEWIFDTFGEDYFGARAFAECGEQHTFRDDPIVFRDATWVYIKPFLAEYKPHEIAIVDLKSYGYTKTMPISEDEYKMFSSRILLFAKPTVENVLAALKDLG